MTQCVADAVKCFNDFFFVLFCFFMLVFLRYRIPQSPSVALQSGNTETLKAKKEKSFLLDPFQFSSPAMCRRPSTWGMLISSSAVFLLLLLLFTF